MMTAVERISSAIEWWSSALINNGAGRRRYEQQNGGEVEARVIFETAAGDSFVAKAFRLPRSLVGGGSVREQLQARHSVAAVYPQWFAEFWTDSRHDCVLQRWIEGTQPTQDQFADWWLEVEAAGLARHVFDARPANCVLMRDERRVVCVDFAVRDPAAWFAGV